MALPLVIHELAGAEALAAYDGYAARDLAAAEKFRSALLDAMDQIAERPELAPPYEGSLRRRLLHGFPYGVLYEAGADAIFVVAIMHLHRHPITGAVDSGCCSAAASHRASPRSARGEAVNPTIGVRSPSCRIR